MKSLLSILLLLSIPSLKGATIAAASASYADVQTAVDSCSSGDTVTIPNGSADWGANILDTGGKQFILRALNYTPTYQPTNNVTRNVVITWAGDGAAGQMIDFTTGNTFHCGVGGIEFRPSSLGSEDNVPPAIYGFVHFAGSGVKPPLVFDCHFVGNNRQNTTASDSAFLSIDSLGAVVWNCFFDGTQVDDGLGGGGGDGMGGSGCHITSPRAWATASTMGTADTGGTNNVYFEDCQFDWWGQLDIDDRGRVAVRHCIQRGIGWQNHGFSSSEGGRHFEQYDCTLLNDRSNRNQARWFWCRGGTALMTDNFISDQNVGYGAMRALEAGDNTTPSGGYPMNRQAGFGHNGSAHVSDPIHIWSNTGGANTDWNVTGSPDWSSYIDEDRDVFVSADSTDAKPGWSKYTYPHPLRSQVDGGGGGDPPAAGPQNLRIKQGGLKLRR